MIFSESESFVIFAESASSELFSDVVSSVIFSGFKSSEITSSVIFSAFDSSVIFTAFDASAKAVIGISEISIARQSKTEIGLNILIFINSYLLTCGLMSFCSFLFMPEHEYPAIFSFIGCTLLSGM